MSEAFLDKVVRRTKSRVQNMKSGEADIRSSAVRVRDAAVPHRFRSELQRQDRINIIAEIKRASPSKGVIKADVDVKKLGRSYESGGAAAISVLTESEYFGGSLEDLKTVCGTVGIPVLRKDFIIDEHQIYEAAAVGADAILLIVAALSEGELRSLLHLTRGLGMDALVEVHTIDEMAVAKHAGAEMIGANNRDLRSLEVSLDVSRTLITERPPGTIMVAESGLSDRREIQELRGLGFDAFLVGERLMRADDIVGELKNLMTDREARYDIG